MKIFFATQRGYGEFKDGWEFPGGKVEPGETPRSALIREIREELDVEIKIGELFDVVEYDYPTFHLEMHCYICDLMSEKITLREHRGRQMAEKRRAGLGRMAAGRQGTHRKTETISLKN